VTYPASVYFKICFRIKWVADSLIISSISAGKPDTTLTFKTSCDSANLGVTEIYFTTPQGCDSIVITTVSFSAQDSTFIANSSCDPADVGVFVQTLTNGIGCDSIVTTTVSLLPSSESFISPAPVILLQQEILIIYWSINLGATVSCMRRFHFCLQARPSFLHHLHVFTSRDIYHHAAKSIWLRQYCKLDCITYSTDTTQLISKNLRSCSSRKHHRILSSTNLDVTAW
jgi:hypothetical protein